MSTMTEREWETCTNVSLMTDYLLDNRLVSDRKWRLWLVESAALVKCAIYSKDDCLNQAYEVDSLVTHMNICGETVYPEQLVEKIGLLKHIVGNPFRER